MPYSIDTSKLDEKETAIWNILKDRYGNEKAITSTMIEELTGLNRFVLSKIIQDFRLLHKIPVVTDKYGKKKGYFLPNKITEIEVTLAELEGQANKLIDVVSLLWQARKEFTYASTETGQ